MAVIDKHQIVQAEDAANVAVEKLGRDSVLAHCVWVNPGGDNANLGVGDQVNITLPALLTARKRQLRTLDDIQYDYLAEVKTSVKLKEQIYQAVMISDGVLTLDIQNFSNQVIAPVMRGVADGIENMIADLLNTTPYDAAITATKDTVLDGVVQGMVGLDRNYVPKENRVIVAGTGVQATLLRNPDLVRYDGSGDNTALRQATIGTLYGMPVVTSPRINSKDAIIMHKSAFPVVLRTPIARPQMGPEWGRGESVTAGGGNFTIRLTHDRDNRKLADTIVADVFAGTGVMKDKGKYELTNGLPTFTPWHTDKDPDTDGQEKLIRAIKLTVSDALG